PGPGRLRGRAALLAAALDLRPADLPAPGGAAQAGRHGHAHPRGAPAHGAGRLNVADGAPRITAAPLPTGRAAERLDVDSRDDAGAAMARLAASETAYAVTLDAMRIHGGYEYTAELPGERD